MMNLAMINDSDVSLTLQIIDVNKKQQCPRVEPCGTPRKIVTSNILFSIFQINIIMYQFTQ